MAGSPTNSVDITIGTKRNNLPIPSNSNFKPPQPPVIENILPLSPGNQMGISRAMMNRHLLFGHHRVGHKKFELSNSKIPRYLKLSGHSSQKKGGSTTGHHRVATHSSHRSSRPTLRSVQVANNSCFNMQIGGVLKELDFQKNLARFDKEGFSKNLSATQRVIPVPVVKSSHDPKENVLQMEEPLEYRQIVPTGNSSVEYVTDEGLVIPAISASLREKLLNIANNNGLTYDRQKEVLVRSACEMILQLVSSNQRMNVRNSHRVPIVVVLSSPDMQGALGVNCARQLECYGVQAYLFFSDINLSPGVGLEASLFYMTKGRAVSSAHCLPPAYAVDFLVACVEDSEYLCKDPDLQRWLATCKAPVLAIDPPASGIRMIPARYSLVPALPLAYAPENGKIYLCNLSIPVTFFENLGIRYKSPFRSKSVVALHLRR